MIIRKKIDFQFPLWDTKSKYKDYWEFPKGLSIPFMGYLKYPQGYYVYYRIIFQFPLWDTWYVEITGGMYFVMYFQFPLWDTFIIFEKDKLIYNFQFPLWDTI